MNIISFTHSTPFYILPLFSALMHNPPLMTWFVHPSCLHSVFAPCLLHTPPLTATFVHPSLLHTLPFAPCFMHTPPSLAWFVHPSLLDRLCFAPCLMHTPPLTAMFVHPSAEHVYLYLFSGGVELFFVTLPRIRLFSEHLIHPLWSYLASYLTHSPLL